MKTRVISVCVALPIFLAVMFFAPKWGFALMYSAVSVIAQHELLYATGIVRNKLVVGIAMVFAAYVPFWVLWGMRPGIALLLLWALVVVLFIIRMVNETYTFTQIAVTLFSIIIPPLFLSLALIIRVQTGWRAMILLPFLAAWMSDTGACLSGTYLGRHKLCEKISPKKTVEGAVGGVLGGIIGGILYWLVMTFVFNLSVSIWFLILLGGLGSVFAQIGDLMFSAIKREHGIKDYGMLMPGHGGVLDRFDSAILTTPLTVMLLYFIPFFV